MASSQTKTTIWAVVAVVVVYLLVAYNKKWFPFATTAPVTPPVNPPTNTPVSGRYGIDPVTTTADGTTICTVYNPNGTARVFTGQLSDPGFAALCQYAQSLSVQPYYYYTYPIYTRFWRFGRHHGGHHGGGGPGVGGPGGPGSGTGGGTGGGTPGSGTGGGTSMHGGGMAGGGGHGGRGRGFGGFGYYNYPVVNMTYECKPGPGQTIVNTAFIEDCKYGAYNG